MAGFPMCGRCRAEYENPSDRRFHAQPNACPDCGPSLKALLAANKRRWGAYSLPIAVTEDDPLRAAADALLDGLIVAVKGIGGYHLACRADDEAAVGRLRSRKRREDKPFALMAPDVAVAATLVELGPGARELLESPARPIVLAPRHPDAGTRVAPSVAPGAPELGVMLPYSPLHHLLLRDAGTTLVMTSGNVSDEPICFRDEEAAERLAPIADLFLVHDRPIETRTDDSVMRAAPTGTTFLRRSRGFVPGALALPGDGVARPLLACGAELKSTFCVAKRQRAWVSHHIGDLSNLETLQSFADGVRHFERLFAVVPEVVVHDLHPDYLSTKYALERDGVTPIGVQHHHAHMAACLAEHGELGAAVGAIFDGTGYGLDGTVWGGEFLYGDLGRFERVGALRAARLPGGEQAIRQPWRMACAWLCETGDEVPAVPGALEGRVDSVAWRQVARLVRSGFASPVTTSVGRLFDAVAALCGVRTEINYEGQAAIELEAACDPFERGSYPIVVDEHGIDPRETIRAVVHDAAAGVSVGVIAARFHGALARATVQACVQLAAARDTEVVVLSGGVFSNRRLLGLTAEGLGRAGLRVLTPRALPPGDGGISFGQAAVAAWRLET
jgi:hydrogenase maturation protein HypF